MRLLQNSFDKNTYYKYILQMDTYYIYVEEWCSHTLIRREWTKNYTILNTKHTHACTHTIYTKSLLTLDIASRGQT